MPLFEYRCASCAGVSELLVGVGQAAADRTVRCEHCGGTQLTKLLSRINIGRSSLASAMPCGESSCPPPGAGCCGGGCSGH